MLVNSDGKFFSQSDGNGEANSLLSSGVLRSRKIPPGFLRCVLLDSPRVHELKPL